LNIKVYKNIIWPVVWYGCDTVCLTKGRTQIDGACEQGAEEDVLTYKGGSGRRLHSKELHDLYV